MRQTLRNWIFIFILLYSGTSIGQAFQNLVPNGSFETYTQCPNNSSQVYFAQPWTGPSTNNSDYLNACAPGSFNVPYYAGINNVYPAYLPAKDGNAYAGIYSYQLNNFREYLQVELLDTLQMGVCYYVEFYAANIQHVKYRSNNIAANLSPTSNPINLPYPGTVINVPMHIVNYGNPVLPDTVCWQRISGLYSAVGNEQFMTIGNFRDDSHTDTVNIYLPGTGAYNDFTAAYIFIDAVSVYSINPNGALPWTYNDTLIENGDSVFIGNKMGGQDFHPKWSVLNGSFIETDAGITVSPTVTTSYLVQYTICGIPRADTITVFVKDETNVFICELEELANQVKTYPLPANEDVAIEISNDRLRNVLMSVELYDQFGRIVKVQEASLVENKMYLSTENLDSGLYFLRLLANGNFAIWKRILIQHE
jgi:hypothetical protein